MGTVCKVCGAPRRRSPAGLLRSCDVCNRARVKAWTALNPEKVQRQRAIAKVNGSKKQGDARYYSTHKEKWRQRAAIERENGVKKVRARREYEKHRQQYIDRAEVWRKAHPERYAEIARSSAKRHPENGRKRQAVRRARMAGVLTTLTLQEWREILATYDASCAYCGASSRALEQDHVVPISKGGGHTKDNVVPACRRCNARKGAKSVEAFHG